MSNRPSKTRPSPRDIAAEIVQRVSSANAVGGMKSRGIDVHAYRPTLIAAEQLKDADLIISFACDAGRKLARGKDRGALG